MKMFILTFFTFSSAIVFSGAQFGFGTKSGISETTRRATRTSAIDSDVIIFPDDKILDKMKPPTFTKEERACFAESHVLFNGSCQELNKRGSCGDNEWLVIDLKPARRNPPKFRPKCEQKRCPPNEIFWPENNNCYNISESGKVCLDQAKELSTDIFGLGYCKCKSVPVHAEYHNGTCYELYGQGPCKHGELFQLKNSDGPAECIVNQCQNKSLVYHEDTKKCYRLGERGPCEGQNKFLVTLNTKRPECVEDLVGLAISPPKKNCYGDQNGKCISSDNLDPQSDRYIETLISHERNRKA